MAETEIKIYYCKKCKWMLRAAWLAQEILSTFEDDVSSVSLVPAEGGKFVIDVIYNGELKTIWNRQETKSFPEAKEIKQRIRDIIDPDRPLGHCDRPRSCEKSYE